MNNRKQDKEERADLGDLIAKSQKRKLRARKEENSGHLWYGLGMFGLVGWSVAIPTLICTAIGIWIDTVFETNYSWTLMFLFIGIVLGSINAWHWVKRESRHD
ncbi:AtpZ/AtpI family protein [candidate division KSB1 bacterium]|nr:AtpZ/AtpI family protein [candidate division KSB1 bacterium]